MALETGTYISDLVITNPVGSDAKSTSDDHHRLIKSTLKATFPNITGAVTPTHTELNYVDGVTSAIQTQIDAKMATSGNDTITGIKTFNDGKLALNGATSGTTTLKATAIAGTGNVTLPTGGTLANLDVSQTFSGGQIGGVTALSVSANAVAVNMALNNNFSLTLQATTSQVLSNPTNATAGQSGHIAITQNGTPSTLTYGSNWKSFDGLTPGVSTTASAKNLIAYYVQDSSTIWFSLSRGGVA